MSSPTPQTRSTTTSPHPAPDRLLRIKGVEDLTTLSKPAIYKMARAGSFPRPVSVTERLSAWRESDVFAWIASRPVKSAEPAKAVEETSGAAA